MSGSESSRCSISTMPSNLSRNHGSIWVIFASLIGSGSRRSAAISCQRRLSVGVAAAAAGSDCSWSSHRSVRRPTSSDRTAFCSADSKVRPIAMTSPVAFICVPRVRLPAPNLSKGQRGIFTTT